MKEQLYPFVSSLSVTGQTKCKWPCNRQCQPYMATLFLTLCDHRCECTMTALYSGDLDDHNFVLKLVHRLSSVLFFVCFFFISRGRAVSSALNTEVFLFVGWLLNVPATCKCISGRLRTILRTATLREKLQIKRSTSPSHSIMTPGRPVPVLDPITPGAWQGSHWSANFESHWYDSTPKKNPGASGIRTRDSRSRGGRLNH